MHFGWRRGVSEGIGRARGFYGVLLAFAGGAVVVLVGGFGLLFVII